MNSKHRKTLEAIFSKPTQGNIKFSDVESLVLALGGEVVEGAGSRVAMHLHGGLTSSPS
ncbi:hypothetical protein [Macromonas bipunctata]|uniref:hypothetical protein n=1 Tax=Macromonas bipunctata TaxID=183670 RepID=UPI001474B23F|nr:hypothetical protein [Macromonas bipunctata]